MAISSTLKTFGLTYSDNCVEKNNVTILLIMDAQVQAQTKELSNCFNKIKNLASELSLNDGLKYLKNFFDNYVDSPVPTAQQDEDCCAKTRFDQKRTHFREHHSDNRRRQLAQSETASPV